MASLFKRLGSPYWFVAFDVRDDHGKIRRVKKSTKRTKRADAMVEGVRLEEVARKASKGTGDAAAKSFNILTEAAEAAARGELSEGRARALLARLTEAATGEALRFYTVRTWAEEWLAHKAANGKIATQARYKSHLDAFLDWLGTKADGRLEAVTKSDLRKFRDAIKKGWGGTGQPRTGKTANYYSKDVAGLFRAAVRDGLLLASPAAGLELLPEDDSTKRETFTLAEIGQMIETAGGRAWQRRIFSERNADPDEELKRAREWQGLILSGFYAGPRLQDNSRLRVGNLNMEARFIDFMPGKTDRKKKTLQVPLHPRLGDYFESIELPSDPAAFLFPKLSAVSVGGKVGLSAQFVAIMEEAGISRGTKRESVLNKAGKAVRRAVHARSFHSLRHSLTSSLANLDVAPEIRQRILGHESQEVHRIYTHHERETLARALEKLPVI